MKLTTFKMDFKSILLFSLSDPWPLQRAKKESITYSFQKVKGLPEQEHSKHSSVFYFELYQPELEK